MNIETIKCNDCERVWPCVSEQGIHTDVYGHCYHCMLTDITKVLTALQDKVDYVITTCNSCAGVEERRVDCNVCDGEGYRVDPK